MEEGDRGIMGKWMIAIIIFAMGLFLFVYGTIVPLIKNKKCTEKVNANIIRKKEKSYSTDDGTNFMYTIAAVRYYYQGKTYKKKINIGLENYKSSAPLKINPLRPEMRLLNNRKLFVSGIVIYTITAVVLIACSVFWVLSICTSILI